MKIKAEKLRNRNELERVSNDNPGYYKWWANRASLDILLEKLNLSFNKLEKYFENEDGQYCIYVGVAIKKSIRERLNWHVNQKHTESAVKSGFLSTFRQSISSIVADNQHNEPDTNDFIDKLEIEYFYSNNSINSPDAKKEIGKIEEEILHSCNLYILNIKNNKHQFAPIRKLKEIRKKAKMKKMEE